MKNPGSRVVGPEPNRGIATNIASIDDVTSDRVNVVVRGVDSSALDYAERMLWRVVQDQRNETTVGVKMC
jgi:predicted component of type VI protein secretion system